METPTEYMLKLVDWQFFGTFTWCEGKLGGCLSREKAFWEYLRYVYQEYGQIKLMRAPVAVRWERGELGDRPHAHALLAGFPAERLNITFCFMLGNIWKQGWGSVRLYDTKKPENIESYITKLRAKTSRANDYEIRKFDYADRLVINDAAWSRMLSRAGERYAPAARTF
jgi:hypothetical protein